MKISYPVVFLFFGAMVAVVGLHQYRLHSSQNGSVDPVAPLAPPALMTASEVPAEPAVVAAAPARRMAEPTVSATNSVFYRFAHRAPSAPVPSPLQDIAVDEAERRLQMSEQVRRMHEYTARAGKDDPFAMTPEAIEAFKTRGDPTIW